MSLTFLPGQIPTESESVMLQNLPAAGQLFYFFNTDKNGDIYSIDSNGNIVFVASVNDDCCSCCLSQSWLDGINQALLNGAMTSDQFTAALAAGFNVNSVNQGGGNCSIVIGSTQPTLVSLAIVPNLDPNHLSVSGTVQFAAIATPVGANNHVVWVSSDTSKVTINASGLATVVATGSATITAYSVLNGAISATTSVTVS